MKGKRLIVFFALALILTIPAMTISNLTVTADVSEATVVSTSWYFAPATTYLATPGDIIAVGEIQNVGSNYLSRVYVAGIAYAANGTYLASSTNQVFGTNVAPQAKAPFYLDFSASSSPTGDLSWVDEVSVVNVTVSYVADATGTAYTGLTLSSSMQNSNNVSTVTGTVRNDGNIATGELWVTTTFYNSAGTVVSLNFTNFLTHSLAPGQVVSFKATPVDNFASSQIATYNSFSEFLPYSAPSLAPTGQPTAHPTSTIQPTGQPTGQPIELNLTNITLIAVAVVAIVVILVVFLIMKRRRKGESPSPSQTPSSDVADKPVSPPSAVPVSPNVEKQATPTKSTIVCGDCGTSNDLDATFCKKCGNRFKD